MKTHPDESISPMFLRQHGKNDFRPATPKEIQEGIFLSHQQGLTKREHFASMAMQGLLASDEFSSSSYEEVARMSVKSADALIAELNKEETK